MKNNQPIQYSEDEVEVECPRCGYRKIKRGDKNCKNCGVKIEWYEYKYKSCEV